MVLSHILRRILEHWLQMDRLHLQQVNLLITEEGWGLSSANWLIKHSAWSVKFLHDALTAAHVELQLFGDQDAMILHLMNRIFFAAKSKVLSSKFSKVSVLINFLCFHLSKPTENVYIYIYIYFIFRFRFTVGPPLQTTKQTFPNMAPKVSRWKPRSGLRKGRIRWTATPPSFLSLNSTPTTP